MSLTTILFNLIKGGENNKMTTSETEETEKLQVTITLSKPIYEIARLLCQFENDLDWNAYVSECIRTEAFTVKNGHCDAFMSYVQRILKDEKR